MQKRNAPLVLASAVGVALLTLATAARAQVVYQDAFARTGDLAGSSPAPVNTPAATWIADAGRFTVSPGFATSITTLPGTFNSNNAFLPLTAATAGVYTLSATLTPTAGGGDWLALGFTQNASPNTAFYAGGVNAELWALYAANGTTQSFYGGGTSNGAAGGTAPVAGAPDTITLTLNSVTGAFTITDTLGLFNRAGTLSPAQIGAINYVGIAQYQNAVGSFSNVTASAVVPEPATLAALVGGLGLAGTRRPRRNG